MTKATKKNLRIEDRRRDWIEIRGARTHNLRAVDVDIPHWNLTVITGPSGCGKSSLALDTLFAEGQRQYLETLSLGARQWIDQLPRPPLESISGLLPTQRVDQHSRIGSPRSTVGTITEIYDYLRVLWARLGDARCSQCGQTIRQQSPEQILKWLMELPEQTKMVVLAPLVRGRKGSHQAVFEQIRKERLVRVRVDGTIYDIDAIPTLNPRQNHSIDAVTDRIVIRAGIETRLQEAIDLSLRLTGQLVVASFQRPDINAARKTIDWEDRSFSTVLACPDCQISLPELEPRSFSFNSPYGACEVCQGMGVEALALSTENESENESRPVSWEQICAACQGSRLNPIARQVRVSDVILTEVLQKPLCELEQQFAAMTFSESQQLIVEPLLREIHFRLGFLNRVGLGYLTLGRAADTLSGGEYQRVRLAAAIGTGLTNVCFILDEPSIGLHPRDTDRLIGVLNELVSRGNSVVVVEHDESVMRAAQCLIDMGPGAGAQGGQIIAAGSPTHVMQAHDSLTGAYLSGRKQMVRPVQRRRPDQGYIRLTGATGHNLKNVDLEIPLGIFTCVTGVSGSGKSTLINQTLVPAMLAHIGLPCQAAAPFRRISVDDNLERLVVIDQQPIGRNSRSCPATFLGLLDEIRKLFAATREAKSLGFKSNRFSFNASVGACSECQGHGSKKLSMSFLGEASVVCHVCRGKRFNPQTLAVKFRGHSIADVLEMPIATAAIEFRNISRIATVLDLLVEIGLGYLSLGQPATTLSGGEAQRLKLALELSTRRQGKTLYVLDEPTTGLHFEDVGRLLGVLNQLVESGNTVLVTEHHLDVMRFADWIVDLGPEGGSGGGRIMATGSPETISLSPTSLTGRFLVDQL